MRRQNRTGQKGDFKLTDQGLGGVSGRGPHMRLQCPPPPPQLEVGGRE